MKSLFRLRSIGIEILRRPAVRRQRTLEANMLDLAFGALGFALIGLMGLYAAALRRL